MDGRQWKLAFSGDKQTVILPREETNAVLPDFSCLSSDSAMRLDWFNREATRVDLSDSRVADLDAGQQAGERRPLDRRAYRPIRRRPDASISHRGKGAVARTSAGPPRRHRLTAPPQPRARWRVLRFPGLPARRARAPPPGPWSCCGLNRHPLPNFHL